MSKLRVTIIDYGLGNLLSLQRAFEFIGADAIITREHKLILGSTHVILPGVGAFPVAMDSIIKFKLKESLLKVANSGIPLLGICLGMQLLLTESEEFEHTKGLNLIPGKVKRIHGSKNKSKKIKIPHIGWNTLIPNNINNNFELKLLEKTGKEDSYYFVHSFPTTTQKLMMTKKYFVCCNCFDDDEIMEEQFSFLSMMMRQQPQHSLKPLIVVVDRNFAA